MLRRLALAAGILIPILLISVGFPGETHAQTRRQPPLAGSPLDLVNAVNALRVSYGLPPYAIDPILMATAQAQADFLALTGTMTHAGPGGIGLTDRLLAAGYPLAGDLSLGGFRSENITGGPESMPADAAVQRWTGDALHLTTMISPALTEIGAGVAVNNGRVYYVIDCALPTDTGLPQAPPGPVEGASPVPAASPVGIIYPVSMSTPNAGGDLIHEVKPGQSLWQIAIAYDTKIDELKRLNNLFDNSIFPGEKLLIRQGVLVTISSPTPIPAQKAAGTSTVSPSSRTAAPPSSLTPFAATSMAPSSSAGMMRAAMAIMGLAVIGGIIVALLGNMKRS